MALVIQCIIKNVNFKKLQKNENISDVSGLALQWSMSCGGRLNPESVLDYFHGAERSLNLFLFIIVTAGKTQLMLKQNVVNNFLQQLKNKQ